MIQWYASAWHNMIMSVDGDRYVKYNSSAGPLEVSTVVRVGYFSAYNPKTIAPELFPVTALRARVLAKSWLIDIPPVTWGDVLECDIMETY